MCRGGQMGWNRHPKALNRKRTWSDEQGLLCRFLVRQSTVYNVYQLMNLAVHMGKLHLQGGDLRVCFFPKCRVEARQDIQFMNAQKPGEHEAEIEKIKNVFLTILQISRKTWTTGNSREKL